MSYRFSVPRLPPVDHPLRARHLDHDPTRYRWIIGTGGVLVDHRSGGASTWHDYPITHDPTLPASRVLLVAVEFEEDLGSV